MSEDDNSIIKTHVPDRGISEITLDNLRSYDDAAILARTGVPKDINFMPRDNNEKVENRLEGLKLMIAYQQHIISGNNMATVETNCYNTWCKKYREDSDRKDHIFEKEENDINEFKEILEFLDDCEQRIEVARRTKKLDDDFVWDKQVHTGEKIKELSPNFFEMFKYLIESYRSIYRILQNNKIVTLGVNSDEEATDKEIEEEQHRRIVES